MIAAVGLLLSGCGKPDSADDPARGRPVAATVAVSADQVTTTQLSTADTLPNQSSTNRSSANRSSANRSSTIVASKLRSVTTLGGPGSVGPGAASAPRRAVVPGVYGYTTAGATMVALTSTPLPVQTTLTVQAPAGSVQRSVRDLRDAAGSGSVTESVFDYRADGVFLVDLRITTTLAGQTDVRQLRPSTPVLFLPTDARTGTGVRFDVPVVAGTGQSVGSAVVTVDVVGLERVVLGSGEALDAMVVRVVVTLPPGDVTGRQELTAWVDIGSGLYLREQSAADVSALGGLIRVQSTYQATLERRRP